MALMVSCFRSVGACYGEPYGFRRSELATSLSGVCVAYVVVGVRSRHYFRVCGIFLGAAVDRGLDGGVLRGSPAGTGLGLSVRWPKPGRLPWRGSGRGASHRLQVPAHCRTGGALYTDAKCRSYLGSQRRFPMATLEPVRRRWLLASIVLASLLAQAVFLTALPSGPIRSRYSSAGFGRPGS